MTSKEKYPNTGLILVLTTLALVSTAGCKSHARVKGEGEKTEAANVAPSPSHPVGGTYCLDTFAQGPADARTLHFSYKQSGGDGSFKDYEGDLTGDKLDSSVHEKHVATDMDRELAQLKNAPGPPVVDGFVETTRPLHETRDDRSGWSMASGGQVQGFTPWGLFIAKPNVKQVGSENTAGFDAIKYSIDTDGQSQLDKMALTLAGGLKDYTIKGNTWVDSKQQCILRYDIDYVEVKKDGTERKTHYEGNTTRQ
jgi:hypothetical protein